MILRMKNNSPSPTHDSEEWLDALTDSIRTMIGNPDYHQEGSLQVIRDMITSHYAHYLKPEDVERVKLEARFDESVGYCDKGHYHDRKRDLAMLPSERQEEINFQLSKLNREEKKDE